VTSQFTLEFPYRRSLGPVVGGFFTGLRDGKVLASRTKQGRVLCPPLEYDPETGEAVDPELIEIAYEGVVELATFIEQPMRKHPLQEPFTWALVKLDGADTALLHAARGRVAPGDRVKIVWREERIGNITDIECFAKL
jgi:uncharacterized OB-fold protein